MLRLLVAVTATGALLTSATTAQAFCRTTTVGIPANYNPQNTGCFEQGLYLFWRNACVSYSISEQASRSVPFADATRIIDGAFGTWPDQQCAKGGAPGISIKNAGSASCTEVRYNPDSSNQNLIVFRDDGWPYNDAYSTLGLTTVTFNSMTGEIFDADMEINSSQRNLSITDAVPANGFDLASVVTHEAGHFYGLAHATSPKSTMFAAYKPGTSELRTLSTDDVAGLCAIYPDAQTRVVSPKASATGTIVAEACDPAPRRGYTPLCEVPKADESCAVTPRSQAPVGSLAIAGLVGAGVLVVRRRRRPQSSPLVTARTGRGAGR